MSDHKVGLAWLNEEDWAEWKRISEDEIDDKYEDWLISANFAKASLEKEGYMVEKVTIMPTEFMTWCKKNKKRADASARSLYTQEQIALD